MVNPAEIALETPGRFYLANSLDLSPGTNTNIRPSSSLGTSLQDGFWVPQPDATLVTNPKYHRLSTILPVRRPLPSSPLAGPVLSSDASIIEIDDIREGRAPTSSTPNLTSHSQSHFHYGKPCKSSSTLSTPSSPSLQNTPTILSSRRLSFRDFSGARKPKMTNSLPSSLYPETPVHGSHPFGVGGTALEVPLEPNTSLLGAINMPEAGNGVQAPGPPTCATPPSNPLHHWMTADPYATTPRFSRLGISAPNVVLPVSAREYRHTSRKASRASMTPSSSTSTSLGVAMSSIISTRLSHSVPSLIFTASSSAGSSRESLAPSPHRSWAPSIESTSGHKDTVEEELEEEVADTEHSPEGPMARLKRLRLKSSRPYIDISPNPSRRTQVSTDRPPRTQKMPPPLAPSSLDNKPPFPTQSSREKSVGRFWKRFTSISPG